jgi:hypothetical protein
LRLIQACHEQRTKEAAEETEWKQSRSIEDRDKPVGPDYRFRLQSVRPSVGKESNRVNVKPSRETRETLKGKYFNL